VYKLSVEIKKSEDGAWHPVEATIISEWSAANQNRVTIRFCLLPKHLIVPLRILALDDMLISYKSLQIIGVKLIETILNLYSEGISTFHFTHEKGFFNEVKKYKW